MLVIIAWGITGVVLVYTILDSQRFVQKWSDKALCLVSCLLLKPVLLPIIMCGGFFRSPIAKGKPGKYVFETNGIQETNFMMAVQETNFLMSFTLSSFSALCTAFAVMNDGDFSTIPLKAMIMGLFYGIYGFCLSVYMYGRKVDPQFSSKNMRIGQIE